jgi:hypothetical protein
MLKAEYLEKGYKIAEQAWLDSHEKHAMAKCIAQALQLEHQIGVQQGIQEFMSMMPSGFSPAKTI